MYRRFFCNGLTHIMCTSRIVLSAAHCGSQDIPPTDNNNKTNNNNNMGPNKPRRVGHCVFSTDEEMTAGMQGADELLASFAVDVAVNSKQRNTARDIASDDDACDDADECEDGGELLRPIDGLLQTEEEEEGGWQAQYILERQAAARLLPPAELVEMTALYLRATENPRLVSADEEHVLFPVVMERLCELRVGQLLDIVECHWARSTLVRYGTRLKDMIRDRIALIASFASKADAQPTRRPLNAAVAGEELVDDDDIAADDVDDAGDIYIHEADKPKPDSILLNARDEMNAECVLRCIVVMGMSAGRRKRDLHFFQAMGMFLVHHINHYKDPHLLVRVLTAFARAKIIPSKEFLALLGRRFAVLNKKKPLGALPSYRALVNMYKMGHDQMNSFKFLANCIFDTIDTNVKAEKKHQRLAELTRKREKGADSTPLVEKREEADAESNNSAMVGDLDPQLLHVVKARERFKRLTELKPSMFTKLLLVLARFGAPHQQYLRPTIVPLILPTLRCFPPPSFSRLLRALHLFKTTDLELIEPIIDHLADNLDHSAVLPEDVLETIRIISLPDVPVPRNIAKLITLCEAVYAGTVASAVRPIRPNDMCSVAAVLLRLQMKDDVPLDALEPLTALMEAFANRLTNLLKLHVISLTHVDIFIELCQQQHHPDVSGGIARLCQERRMLATANSDDEDDDNGYYSQLDIDVRETFHKIMVVNDYKTYGQYRPTPGVLQVDFKQALTEVSAFDVLEATHIFNLAFPNALQPTVTRHLSRSIIAKLGSGGEEVITEENEVVLRPPRELLLRRADLARFVELVQKTPLARVKESSVVWGFIAEKARRLKMSELLESASQKVLSAAA